MHSSKQTIFYHTTHAWHSRTKSTEPIFIALYYTHLVYPTTHQPKTKFQSFFKLIRSFFHMKIVKVFSYNHTMQNGTITRPIVWALSRYCFSHRRARHLFGPDFTHRTAASPTDGSSTRSLFIQLDNYLLVVEIDDDKPRVEFTQLRVSVAHTHITVVCTLGFAYTRTHVRITQILAPQSHRTRGDPPSRTAVVSLNTICVVRKRDFRCEAPQ